MGILRLRPPKVMAAANRNQSTNRKGRNTQCTNSSRLAAAWAIRIEPITSFARRQGDRLQQSGVPTRRDFKIRGSAPFVGCWLDCPTSLKQVAISSSSAPAETVWRSRSVEHSKFLNATVVHPGQARVPCPVFRGIARILRFYRGKFITIAFLPGALRIDRTGYRHSSISVLAPPKRHALLETKPAKLQNL